MSAWVFISSDTLLVSGKKSDKEYMERQKKVLTERKQFVQIIKPKSGKYNKINTTKYE